MGYFLNACVCHDEDDDNHEVEEGGEKNMLYFEQSTVQADINFCACFPSPNGCTTNIMNVPTDIFLRTS